MSHRAMPVALAVDWSGAVHGAKRKIWLAEANERGLVRLECGLDRTELVLHLVALARENSALIVGLDFAFSFPSWFFDVHAVESVQAMWRLVAARGEQWLAESPHPFWGRHRRARPQLSPAQSHYRRTESESLAVSGVMPKSVFQIGGAGSVGTGSLRGMPFLLALRDAGFAIWPFDEPRLPVAIEIYPRYLTGPVTKSKAHARALYLQRHCAHESRALVDLAVRSEDAFDAAISAISIARHANDIVKSAAEVDPTLRLEGRIWRPVVEPFTTRGARGPRA